jgi:hypothetical protein
MGRTWTQAATYERQQQRFGLKWFDRIIFQAMAQQRDQRLRTWVDAQMLATKSQSPTSVQQRSGCQLAQQWLGQTERHARITTVNGMTDAITFFRVEEQHMIGIRHSLIATHMTDVNTAIRENEMGCRDTFFGTAMTTLAYTPDVLQRQGFGIQQAANFKFGHDAD